MDGSETNFSGWRGAVDEARKGFVADQLNLVRRLHKPAYEWWLSRLIEEDKELRKWSEKSKLNIYGHNWNLPTWSYIEPVADAEGDATQLRNALTSPRRLHNARGGDWEETADEIVEDNFYAIDKAAKKAAEFNAANPTSPPINWRDLMPLVMPAGQTLALQDPAMVEAQADGATGEVAPVDGQVAESQINVAATALNGAQVTSLMDVVTQVGTGAMPKETAIAVINAAFPTMTPEQIAAIIDPIKPGTISADGVPTLATPGEVGSDGKPVQQEAGAEMIGVKRSDWKNSRKAIKDILQEMIDKTISEQRARLELDSLGIPPAKIDLYITDALDGQVDTPEVNQPVAKRRRSRVTSKMQEHVLSVNKSLADTLNHVVARESSAPAVVNVTAPDVYVTNQIPATAVNVTNDVQPATVNVNLPTRKTTTTVFRNPNNGAILGSEQIEKDVP
jgi:hypothetical protein